MPLVRVDPEVYSGLKTLLNTLKALGKAKSMNDVVKYLLSLSPLEDLMSARSAKELALLYAQLASKSWEAVNEEVSKVCGSGVDDADEESMKCVEDYLRRKLGLSSLSEK